MITHYLSSSNSQYELLDIKDKIRPHTNILYLSSILHLHYTNIKSLVMYVIYNVFFQPRT